MVCSTNVLEIGSLIDSNRKISNKETIKLKNDEIIIIPNKTTFSK